MVDDQIGCPTWTRDLADATRRLISVKARGTVHFSNGGQASWFDFARFVLESSDIKPVSFTRVKTTELSLAAARPLYSVLSKERYERLTRQTPRRWDVAAQEFLDGQEGSREC